MWKKIIAVIDATFAVGKRKPVKIRWFSYIHNFIMILSLAYNEPIQRPAPSWLVSSIQVKALHRYRSHSFDSRTSRFFFQALFSQLQCCVYNLRWSVLFHIIFTHLHPSAEDTSGEAGHFFYFILFFLPKPETAHERPLARTQGIMRVK